MQQHSLTLTIQFFHFSELGQDMSRFAFLIWQIALHLTSLLVENSDRRYLILKVRVRACVRMFLFEIDIALKLVHILAEL